MNAMLPATTALTPAPPPLNQGQAAAAEAFFQFLFSDHREMIISGPGGVGKTHLMGHMIDVILPRYHETCKLMGLDPQYDVVDMTATTNKASETLSLSTNRPTSTIHSLLCLKVMDDYDTGVSKLIRTKAWAPHERKIIFIDEDSMIDTPLLEQIRGGTVNCKIVYVGDHCQLAPIKEEISPIFKQGLPFFELTEPMRTSNPHLLALNKQLRNTVETGIFQPIQIVPGVIDYLDDDAMQAEISQAFLNQGHDCRILAYTNKRVVEYNDFVRELRHLPPEFITGEKLVNNTALHMKDRMLSVEEEVEIVSQVGTTDMVMIEDNVLLECRRSDLRSKLGETFKDILLPVDRNHFEALIKYYTRKTNWNRMYHLKNNFPDLRQRDAATVHKTQGSTLGTVYIDTGNISTCNIAHQVARMLYVAASRAKYRVCFYGELAQKYGGFIH